MRARYLFGLLLAGLLLAAQPLSFAPRPHANYAGSDRVVLFPGLSAAPVEARGFSSSSFSSRSSFSSSSFSSSRSYSSPSYSSSSFSSSRSYSSPSYTSSRPSFSFSSPARSTTPSTPSRGLFSGFSRPATPAPAPKLITSPVSRVSVASSAYRPASPYRVNSITTKATYQRIGLAAPVRTLPPPGGLLRTSYASTPLRVSRGGFATPINAARPAYAGYHYQGLYYQPTIIHSYEQEPFPFFQFWLWNQAFNHPYGADYPVGYGPPMGANGSWATSGPAVYDWRRDPCAPRRFFLVRMLFCHKR